MDGGTQRGRSGGAGRKNPARGESDRALLADLDRTLADAARRAGDWLACRPGCSQCCLGPFPITRLDAVRLRRGMRWAARHDPEGARRIQERAGAAVRRLREGYPGDPDGGRLGADEAELDRFFAGHAALPCPVLDPEIGRCELYEQRPVACRTYGPPLRHGDRDVPHCPLCFRGAAPEEIERCRVEPDAADLEQTLLAGLGVQGGDEWETLIAFAVLQ